MRIADRLGLYGMAALLGFFGVLGLVLAHPRWEWLLVAYAAVHVGFLLVAFLVASFLLVMEGLSWLRAWFRAALSLLGVAYDRPRPPAPPIPGPDPMWDRWVDE